MTTVLVLQKSSENFKGFNMVIPPTNYKKIEDYYPYLENQIALHSADKAKKLLSDSISYIEDTLWILEKAIKSM